MRYLVKNGHIIDPANKLDDKADILISGGKIEKIGKDLGDKADAVIDASGMIVMPGLVDMHTHLREPGREDEETIASGTRAAVKGGYTTVACMPNTDPALDDPAKIKIVKDIIAQSALCNCSVIGAITLGRAGKKAVDIAAMKAAGAAGLSDDGACVEDGALLSQTLKEAGRHNFLIIEHCENTKISGNGVINKGFTATKMGLRGIPRQSEYEMVARDIELNKKIGARIHIAHVSCKESVEIIRKAKKDKVKITAETAPHYFTLTEECCVTYDTNTKMNPPLRTKEDVEAIKEGLRDGTIDVIATDHAPHTDAEKDVEFDFAPFGIIGLETALSLSAMELVEKKILSWQDLIMKMSVNPASILGIDRGSLKIGKAADITIADPGREYVYSRASIGSKSKNSPFIDWKLKTKVRHVFVGGKLVLKDDAIE